MARRPIAVCAALLAASGGAGWPSRAAAQDAPIPAADNSEGGGQIGGEIGGGAAAATRADCDEPCAVSYDRDFYGIYNPVNALDMVERTPGFSLDEGEEVRGFGGAAGNVLINGKRPSTKQNSIRDILRRIPAESVERIELIRGATGGLDINSQSVVANVVTSGAIGRGSGVWQAQAAYRRKRVLWDADASYTKRFGATEITLGAQRRFIRGNFRGFERLFTARTGFAEFREENENRNFQTWSGSFQSETRFGNGDVLRFNAEGTNGKFERRETSLRRPAGGGDPDLFVQFTRFPGPEIEIGADYEHQLSEDWRAKLIALANRVFDEPVNRLDVFRADGAFRQTNALAKEVTGEQIGRIELDWAAARSHAVQLSGEVANTFVDSELDFFITENGVRAEVDLPGANTRVGEMRYEATATDSWRASPAVTVDIGMGAEYSVITQTGDSAQSRAFFYPKPRVTLTYAPSQAVQWRIRGERQVAQLDFGDFVSSSNVGDDDLDLGNPDLRPSRTWFLEAAHERRFGAIGVATLSLTYERVTDVIDQLPLSGVFETPGNIGDGRRFAAQLEGVLPLSWTGLANAQLEFSARARDTRVTDPVTGDPRPQSGREAFNWSTDFRQEFPQWRTSWGWSVSGRSDQTFFGLDETDRTGEGVDVSAFVEHAFAGGVKANLELQNATAKTARRDRIVFQGARDMNELRFIEIRRRDEGPRIVLKVNGSF